MERMMTTHESWRWSWNLGPKRNSGSLRRTWSLIYRICSTGFTFQLLNLPGIRQPLISGPTGWRGAASCHGACFCCVDRLRPRGDLGRCHLRWCLPCSIAKRQGVDDSGGAQGCCGMWWFYVILGWGEGCLLVSAVPKWWRLGEFEQMWLWKHLNLISWIPVATPHVLDPSRSWGVSTCFRCLLQRAWCSQLGRPWLRWWQPLHQFGPWPCTGNGSNSRQGRKVIAWQHEPTTK